MDNSDVACLPVYLSSGAAFPWVDEMRYLSIFIVRARAFKCSLDHAKKSFYRAIFGKMGRVASEKVTLQLIKSKCLPVLLYGLESSGIPFK